MEVIPAVDLGCLCCHNHEMEVTPCFWFWQRIVLFVSCSLLPPIMSIRNRNESNFWRKKYQFYEDDLGSRPYLRDMMIMNFIIVIIVFFYDP